MARRQFQHAESRQHSVGICAGKPVGYAAVHGVGEGGIMKCEQFQHAGARQHSVGICAGKAVGYAAVHGVGEGGIMSPGQFQHAESRQHGVGICAGQPVGYAAVRGVPESALASFFVMGQKAGRLKVYVSGLLPHSGLPEPRRGHLRYRGSPTRLPVQ